MRAARRPALPSIVARSWRSRSRSSPRRAAPARPPRCAPSPTCSAAWASRCSRSTSIRRATCPTTSTSRPTPTRRSPTCSRARRRRPTRSTTTCCPANLGLAESELILGGKMGREMTLRRALRDVKRRYDVILIDCPPALGLLTVNAVVAADYALRLDRGAVLLAPGRRAGARGDRAGEGEPPSRPRVARRRAEHRRPAHDPLARGARPAQGALRREAVRLRRSAPRSATRSRPSGASRSSTTAPSSAPTTSSSPRRCSRAIGMSDERGRVAELRAELVPGLAVRAGSALISRTVVRIASASSAPRCPRTTGRSP